MSKQFTILIFRSGEAFHNIGVHKENLKFTDGRGNRTINSSLTSAGIKQANLLAERLKNTKIDLVISSDLKRAIETTEVLQKKNCTISYINCWKVLRERCFGDFEGSYEICKALLLVENAVTDRLSLTWAPPGGESVKDLKNRVYQFLDKIYTEARKIPLQSPIILISSHELFMNELQYVVSDMACGSKRWQSSIQRQRGYQNTGVAQYTFTITSRGTHNTLNGVDCPMISCAHHLQNHDPDYLFCYGGCHDVADDPSSGEVEPVLVKKDHVRKDDVHAEPVRRRQHSNISNVYASIFFA